MERTRHACEGGVPWQMVGDGRRVYFGLGQKLIGGEFLPGR
jgi:hypothetical protein